MSKETETRIDLGLAATLVTLVLAAAFYCSNVLRGMPANDGGVGLAGLPWILLTGFLAAIIVPLMLGLLARMLTTIQSRSEYWETLAYSMFQFSVYLLIAWLISWGTGFGISMTVFELLLPVLSYWIALPIGIVVGLIAIVFINVLIPPTSVRDIFQASLTATVGRFRAAIVVAACFLVGMTAVHTCCEFIVSGNRPIYHRSDTLELAVTVTGTITNLQSLSARLHPVGSDNAPVYSLQVFRSDEGKLIAWRNLNDLDPGLYTVTILFAGYEAAGTLAKLGMILKNNHHSKQLTFCITD